jgi:hypothetical protein
VGLQHSAFNGRDDPLLTGQLENGRFAARIVLRDLKTKKLETKALTAIAVILWHIIYILLVIIDCGEMLLGSFGAIWPP